MLWGKLDKLLTNCLPAALSANGCLPMVSATCCITFGILASFVYLGTALPEAKTSFTTSVFLNSTSCVACACSFLFGPTNNSGANAITSFKIE